MFELVNKIFPAKKTLGPDAFMDVFIQTFKDEMLILHKLLPPESRNGENASQLILSPAFHTKANFITRKEIFDKIQHPIQYKSNTPSLYKFSTN